jgi:hypothetical protein
MEVQGKDALMFFNLDGTFKEFGCAENITVDSIAEIIETSTVGTGTDRTFDYQSKAKTISLTGLVLNDDPTLITVWDLWDQQDNFLAAPFRIVFTDTGGTVKTLSGDAIFPNINLSADQTDLASSSISMQVTGTMILTHGAIVPIVTIQVVNAVGGGATGQITTLTLTDPVTLAPYLAPGGPFLIGTSTTWDLDGVGGNPVSGTYFVEATTNSNQADNIFITNAPPGGQLSVPTGAQSVNTFPFGTLVQYDFTANRNVRFVIGTPVITIEVTGAGSGQITSITLTDPTSLAVYTFSTPVVLGTSDTWTLDGAGGNPPPGNYYIELTVTTDQNDNQVTIDAPPTVFQPTGIGTYTLNTTPFGATIDYDFTQSRTITFNIGTA